MLCRLGETAGQAIRVAWSIQCSNLTWGFTERVVKGLGNDPQALLAAALLPTSGLQLKYRSVRIQDPETLTSS